MNERFQRSIVSQDVELEGFLTFFGRLQIGEEGRRIVQSRPISCSHHVGTGQLTGTVSHIRLPLGKGCINMLYYVTLPYISHLHLAGVDKLPEQS